LKVESLIQANFINDLPPHLQLSAKDVTYSPGSDQSRIFVASHSEFSCLHDEDIQRILRERLILVHGNPFDYNYGWDLKKALGSCMMLTRRLQYMVRYESSFYDLSCSHSVQFHLISMPMIPTFAITRVHCDSSTK